MPLGICQNSVPQHRTQPMVIHPYWALYYSTCQNTAPPIYNSILCKCVFYSCDNYIFVLYQASLFLIVLPPFSEILVEWPYLIRVSAPSALPSWASIAVRIVLSVSWHLYYLDHIPQQESDSRPEHMLFLHCWQTVYIINLFAIQFCPQKWLQTAFTLLSFALAQSIEIPAGISLLTFSHSGTSPTGINQSFIHQPDKRAKVTWTSWETQNPGNA